MSAPSPSFHQLGGWDLDDSVKDPRDLYRITIYTSVDSWDEYVLARSVGETATFLADRFPDGFYKGFEPKVEKLSSGFDSIYTSL